MLLIATLACKPVVALGWNELLILFLMVALLLGPPLYRWIRRIEAFREHEKKEDQ